MIELFVPGRLCLFGEHSDWAGEYRRTHPEIAPGHCLVAGTDQGLHGRAERMAGCLEISSEFSERPRELPLRLVADSESLPAIAASESFFSYAAATFAELRERYGLDGLRLTVRSNLPVRSGLSSSAAICVLVARAASHVYGLGLSIEREMEIAYAGERRTGSECGRMDQACAFGRGAVAMHIDGGSLRFEPIEPGSGLHLLIVDLRGAKDTRKILSDLNACFPTKRGPIAAGVRRALGERNREIVQRAEQHVMAGDARSLGELMTDAQRVFDQLVAPACSELKAPRLHEVLSHPALAELAWGAKGVGSQGDGCAQIVARGAAERSALAARLESELGVGCLPMTLEP